MINARELRIGNYVNRIVTPSMQNGRIKPSIDLWRIECTDFCSFENFEPIPLTEQWLIDFGFVNAQIGLFEIKILSRGSINIHTNRRDIKFVELGTTGHFLFGIVDVKFVHQLQNLYFALTGKELTKK